MTKNARLVAFNVLCSVNLDNAYANLSLKDNLRGLDSRDSAFITRIVYGVLQNRILLDFYINTFANNKKIKPKVREILRIGAYQIIFMEKVPDNAAVNECVNIIKLLKMTSLSGFVNAILRNISKNKEALPEIPKENYLSIKYSHPQWLVDMLLEQYDAELAEEILKSNNDTAPIVCRVNTIKTDVESVTEKLKEIGVQKCDDNAIIISKTGNIERLEPFINGEIYVQDFASQMAVYALNPTKGSTLIDVCSAPGGKSFLAAQYMQNSGEILSLDIHKHKIELIEKTAEKLSIDIIKSFENDATILNNQLINKADFVICDVPCSGLGIIRRKPEIRFKEDISNLPEIQLKILQNSSQYVKKNGALLYSTCTIIKQENADVVNKFLAQNDDFYLEEFEVFGQKQSMITLLTPIHKTDGFFIAKLRRK